MTLSRSVIEGPRIPSPLRMLLLARLVTDDIRSLWSPVASNPAPQRDSSALRLPENLELETKADRKRSY